MGTEEIAVQEGPSELEQKIIRQIEYYFGNYNLGRDKYLKEEMKKDDGWIPLENMIKFQRLKQLTVDFETISSALKKSPNQLMEVNEDCTKIRRTIPLPENVDKNEIESRTLYVKGFTRETSLDQILDFFKEYKVENVMMKKKRYGDKYFFKGAVFATFETQEDCDSFFEKKGIKFGKTEILKERKKDYVKRKDEYFENLRAERAQKKEGGESVISVFERGDFPKGALLKISGINDKTVQRADIKKALEEHGKISFVEFYPGQTDAIVRFNEGIVPEILSKVEDEEDGTKKLQLGSEKATLSLVDGEEETKYLEKIKSFSKPKQGNQKHFNKGKFNKKNRNKNQWGRKRNDNDNGRDNDERPSKRVRTDDATEASADPPKSDGAATDATQSVQSDSKPDAME